MKSWVLEIILEYWIEIHEKISKKSHIDQLYFEWKYDCSPFWVAHRESNKYDFFATFKKKCVVSFTFWLRNFHNFLIIRKLSKVKSVIIDLSTIVAHSHGDSVKYGAEIEITSWECKHYLTPFCNERFHSISWASKQESLEDSSS